MHWWAHNLGSAITRHALILAACSRVHELYWLVFTLHRYERGVELAALRADPPRMHAHSTAASRLVYYCGVRHSSG